MANVRAREARMQHLLFLAHCLYPNAKLMWPEVKIPEHLITPVKGNKGLHFVNKYMLAHALLLDCEEGFLVIIDPMIYEKIEQDMDNHMPDTDGKYAVTDYDWLGIHGETFASYVEALDHVFAHTFSSKSLARSSMEQFEREVFDVVVDQQQPVSVTDFLRETRKLIGSPWAFISTASRLHKHGFFTEDKHHRLSFVDDIDAIATARDNLIAYRKQRQ